MLTAWRTRRSIPLGLVGALAAVNVHAAHIIGSVQSNSGIDAAASLFGISAILWFAIYAMIAIAYDPSSGHEPHGAAHQRPLSHADTLVIAAALILTLTPWHVLALPAMLMIGGWCVVTAPPGASERRIGIILLTIGASIVIARLLLNGVGDSIVAFDASFVAWLAGVESQRNVVDFASAGGRSFIIGLPCSSVHNISLAAVLWCSVVQRLGMRIDVRLIGYCLLAMAGLFLVNAARLATIAWYPQHFDTIHNGSVGAYFGFASLIVAGAAVAWGVLDAHRRHG